MAIFEKKESFMKQITIYLNGENHQDAYELSKQFVEKFTNEMIAHFLLAKSAFRVGKYDETAIEGRKAFNLSNSPYDALASALVTATGYYQLEEYNKGYEILKSMEQAGKSEDLQFLLFMFSLARKDTKEAAKHGAELYVMNRRATEDLIGRLQA